MYPGTRASESGMVAIGDIVRSINGQSLACSKDENPLEGAMKVLAEVGARHLTPAALHAPRASSPRAPSSPLSRGARATRTPTHTQTHTPMPTHKRRRTRLAAV